MRTYDAVLEVGVRADGVTARDSLDATGADGDDEQTVDSRDLQVRAEADAESDGGLEALGLFDSRRAYGTLGQNEVPSESNEGGEEEPEMNEHAVAKIVA